LELEKQEELVKRLSQDFEVYKRNQFDVVKEQVDFAFETLFTNIAASVSLLETLRHILNTQGETKIQPKDVLQAANTVISQLESHELELIGKIGDIVGFDRNIHELG
jgi:molecular chaperone GrpE (heat shock protein)